MNSCLGKLLWAPFEAFGIVITELIKGLAKATITMGTLRVDSLDV